MAARKPEPSLFDPESFSRMFQAPDMTKMMESFRLPGFDMSAMLNAQKRNADAIVAANQAAAAGYREIMRRQMEIFQETMTSAQGQFVAMGETDPAKQADMMRAAFERGVGNMHEIAESSRKAAEEAFTIISKRMQESVQELGSATKS